MDMGVGVALFYMAWAQHYSIPWRWAAVQLLHRHWLWQVESARGPKGVIIVWRKHADDAALI